MTWAGVAVIVLTAFLALGWRATKGPKISMSDFEWPVRGLLRQGYQDGYLVISEVRSRKFVQFEKYIRAPGDYGIAMVFPKAPWSEIYYAELLGMCKEQSRDHVVTTSLELENPMDFLMIDFGKDHRSAADFTRRVFVEVLEIPEDRKFYCKLDVSCLAEVGVRIDLRA